MFLPNKTIKNKKINYRPKKKSVIKTTQYGGYVVMFLPNKIIKNKKLNYPHKKMLPLSSTTHCFIVNGLGGPCKLF